MKPQFRAFSRFSVLLVVAVATRAATVPPGNYVLAQISVDGGAGSINSIGQVLVADGLWTPVVANSNVGAITAINGTGPFVGGSAINNRGQIVGQLCTPGVGGSCQSVLWSPDSPNGTVGSVVTLPLSSGPIAINSVGQVINGVLLWTPSSPNGASGTTTDFRGITGIYSLIGGINDLGQVAVYEADTSVPHLFTPSTPNGSSGTLTPLPGMGLLAAVNNNGTVLGANSDSSGNWHGYLWTPTSPNGTAGTVSEIPIPAGFTQLRPFAINDSGQVVGWLMQNATTCSPATCGLTVPFLYSGGTIYDLTAVDARLAGATPGAINAAGQITLGGADGNGYLLSPTPALPPPGSQTVPITVTSLPPGRGFTVGGNGCSPGAYVSPQTLNWIPQSNCTVAFASPQNDATTDQYVFSGWQDGSTANPRAIIAPSQPATYTANFTTLYLVTATSNPPEGGSVFGVGWYGANSTAVLTAMPASGFRFAGWGSIPAFSAVGPDSASITVSGPLTIRAEFAAITGPALTNYTVTTLGSVLNYSTSLNSFGQVVFGSSLWTPFTPNGTTGTVANLDFVAAGINSRGQIAGSSGSVQALLWSPAAPNGSSGSAIPVPAASPLASLAVGINNFGQVIGESGGLICGLDCLDMFYPSSFLWTPSAPNGATGTVNADAAGDHFVAINNFGQAINSRALYTPFAPNGGSGTLTPISGLPGSNYALSAAINDSGVIVGASSSCTSNSCSQPAGFLWTPVTANSSVGAASPLPVPAGYLYLNPVALNNSGQLVGTMLQSNGRARPFLYRDGTVYDIGTLSSQFSTAIPTAINDSGQIVLAFDNGSSNTMCLLTPAFQTPALTLSHIGNFTQGQSVATFTISVLNNTAAPTTGATVTDALPPVLTAAAVYAPGWTCTLVPLTCSRSDSLAAGATYPPIAVTVGVAYGAPPQVTNRALLTSGISGIVATDTIYIAVPFADVSAADQFLPAIDLLRQYGITNGCGSSPPTYCPADDITRGEMGVFIVRAAMGGDNFTYSQTPYFTDVPATHPFFKWIQKMRDLGITSGCSATTYCPDNLVTRGEMAVFIIRARYGSSATFAYSSTPLFTDVPASNSFFPWIQKMMQTHITSGCGPTTYCPDDPATRGEMAVFIMRGAFNQLLPANTPVVTSVSPASASAGQTLAVTIAGQNTNFLGGATQVSFGDGITVNNVTVADAATITAELTVNAGAVLGPRSITVTTGTQEATLPNGFRLQ